MQEVQYDPVGLELAGLTPPSPGIRGLNNYRFNGKEFQADLGLNWNHQDWRFLDPTILHWNGVDPEIENGQESWGPYSFGYDNAVRYNDPNGRCPCEGIKQTVNDVWVTSNGAAAAVLDDVFGTSFGEHDQMAGDYRFEGGNRLGHTAMAIVGAYLTVSGATEVDAGLGVAGAAGLSMAGTAGVDTPLAAPTAAAGLALAGVGALKGIAGAWVMSNAGRNLRNKDGNNKPTRNERTEAKKESRSSKSSKNSTYGSESEHTGNASESNRNTHEKGAARKGRDKGGEKGDVNRNRYQDSKKRKQP